MPDASKSAGAAASFEVLTGAARGTVCWLNGATLDLSLDDENRLRIATAASESAADGVVARLHRADAGYEIEALGEQLLWINGQRQKARRLEPRDLVEFGDAGPLVRFRLHYQGERLARSLGDMLDDMIDYTRASRRPRLARLRVALRDLFADFALRTTLVFRVVVLVALGVLAYIAWLQYQAGVELQRQAQSRDELLEDFSRTLTRTSEEAIRPADLNQLRQELKYSLGAAAERLEQLEKRSEAAARVIAEATRSIVFLQGSYGYRDVESRRMLRYQTDADGRPLFSLRGRPLLTLEGDGEVAQLEFTGTAFVVDASGVLLTNRHVAQPWEDDASLEAMRQRGMEPVLLQLLGYLPGIARSYEVELEGTGEDTDLAVLRCRDVDATLPALRLSARVPQPGDEVIVMGYPTGMRALLAQTAEDFIAELEQDGEFDFWLVAQKLSQAGHIRPLASRGIVAQRSEVTVVYDADTTHGGSGGPVLDTDGGVIAINTAIIPEYGGSNFGIPIDFARRLLDDAGVEID